MTHNDSQVEVLPCPFCGERAYEHSSGGWHGVGCLTSKCPAMRHALMFRSEADAIAAWNRRTALSALAAGKVGAWQPIETVPKDGTEVILRNGDRVGAACWVRWPARYEFDGCPIEEEGEGWTIGYDGDTWEDEKAPTHYQPLPAASPSPLSADPESAVVGARQHGFTRDDLECIAEGLEKGYERTVNVGNTTGEGDEHLESTTAAAARFIRAAIAPTLPHPALDRANAGEREREGMQVRQIEDCPELNLSNYDAVDVERLNEWAIRADAEIERLAADPERREGAEGVGGNDGS